MRENKSESRNGARIPSTTVRPPSDGLPQPHPYRTIRDGFADMAQRLPSIETTSWRRVTSRGSHARVFLPIFRGFCFFTFSFSFSSLLSLSEQPATASRRRRQLPRAATVVSRRLAVLAPEASPIPGQASPAASSADEPLPCELSHPLPTSPPLFS